eukprot:2265488-Lingulodinium_polyedra.AAC.1
MLNWCSAGSASRTRLRARKARESPREYLTAWTARRAAPRIAKRSAKAGSSRARMCSVSCLGCESKS